MSNRSAHMAKAHPQFYGEGGGRGAVRRRDLGWDARITEHSVPHPPEGATVTWRCPLCAMGQ
eukprot:3521864-Alexandrium_andersonii.AAC.1